jgi:hypothetical protein
MYMVPANESNPPQPGGCLTQWHDHTDVCLASTVGVVATVAADGSCPAGSVSQATSLMMHVWSVDLPAGPFSEIQANDRAAIAAAIRSAATARS